MYFVLHDFKLAVSLPPMAFICVPALFFNSPAFRGFACKVYSYLIVLWLLVDEEFNFMVVAFCTLPLSGSYAALKFQTLGLVIGFIVAC